MTVQLEFWHVISVLLTFFGFAAGVGKLLLMQTQQHIDRRFEALEKNHSREAENWLRVERDLNSLRSELPINYVRRDDYIRGQSVLESKLDALAVKLENAQLRGQFIGVRDGN